MMWHYSRDVPKIFLSDARNKKSLSHPYLPGIIQNCTEPNEIMSEGSALEVRRTIPRDLDTETPECVCPHLGEGRVMSLRAFFARSAPMAVFTCFLSSGGGSTDGNPSESIHNSRAQPFVW